MASKLPRVPQSSPPAAGTDRQVPADPPRGGLAASARPEAMAPVPPGAGVGAGQGDLSLGVAVRADGGGVVTARRAGGSATWPSGSIPGSWD